jgi:hypothetical protein
MWHSLSSLCLLREGKRKRESSWDRTGGNRDFYWLESGAVITLCDITGAGCVNHIWMTLGPAVDGREEEYIYRKTVIRMYWDDDEQPSVEVPIGDFFGMGHGIVRNFVSAPLMMSPENGKSFNSFFAMPFFNHAHIEVESNCVEKMKCYFYIDYEQYNEPVKDALHFHASWRREITKGVESASMSNTYFEFGGKNTAGDGNYLLLEAEGRGHYVGCNINIHNLRSTREWNWYGEGDDMIFIDGEKWPPTLHGTGMEDYFCTAWCPHEEYNAPYHGIILGGGENWAGKVTFYRYHILDPIMFEKSIKVTIEHGHNNHRSDDYSSTAYWYQTEPHKTFEPLPPVEKQLPLPDTLPFDEQDMKRCFAY